jgi:radical SAM superfamily enzyme YgiQ (UPF0313 family)
MRYEGVVYRPPSEAGSLIIQATIGCPHNKCTFCSLYKDSKFKIRPVASIKEDLAMAYKYYGNNIYSIFFADGNTIIMKTDQLVDIFEYSHSIFPNLERITVYGAARFVNLKSQAELSKLSKAGLSRVHTGMESGDDIVLSRIQKGTTSQEIISAGFKLKEAGIEISEYYLVGIGGQERTAEHALNSARTLSAFSPQFIRLRTFVPIIGTPLYDEYKNGTFQLLSPHQALNEIHLLIQNLDCLNSMVLSDHVSNYWDVKGLLPGDKNLMLNQINQALSIDESQFRPSHLSRL